MKNLLLVLALTSFALPTFAAETVSEKAASTGRDIKRAGKKALNRAEEAVCMEGDVKCAAEKAKNRVGEGVETAKDKAKDVKESVD